MRDWLKGMFGGSAPAPDGIPENWVDELRTMLAEAFVVGGTNLSGKNLDDAVEFVLRGRAGNWRHPVPPRNPRGHIGYNNADRPEQPAFYAALPHLPGDLLLRWAQVLESMAFISQYSPYQMIFPGAVHWPEVVLVYGANSNVNVYPPQLKNQRIAYGTIEKMLMAAGMDPQELLVRAFATPVDVGYGTAARLVAVTHCPDYAEALDRHIECLRPHLLAGSAAQRVHVLSMMGKAAPATLDKLAHELAELSVASSKQVRIAAEGLVQSAGEPMVETLRKVAVEGKPEQRQFALRHLFERGQRGNHAALCEFARTTAAADKAASVQALPAEWDTSRNAVEAPEAKYDYEMPVVSWSDTLDAALSARLDKLWDQMNGLIREQNKQTREHYERYAQQHGKPKWKLHQVQEISSSWLKELKNELNTGKPPAKDSRHSLQHHWSVVSVIDKFASDAALKPTQLFKILHFLSLMFDHRSSLNHIAVQSFNNLYAASGRPTLIELSKMVEEAGENPAGVFASYCSTSRSLARGWRDEDVWPFIAHHVPTIERFLLGLEQTNYWFDREMLYQAVSVLPTPPPRIVNALFTVALGQGKSERLNAQEALANQPDKEARIIAGLADGKSEIRMVAAQWLGRLRYMEAIPALSKAVAAEKHDTAKGAMLDALQILGEPVDKYLKRDALLPEAKKTLAKPIPKDFEWIPWDTLPEVRWADNGEAVAPEVVKWMVVQAGRAKSAEPNAVLRKYCAMFEPRDRERFGQWVLDHWLREDIAPIPPEEANNFARTSAKQTHSSMKSHPQYYQNHPLLGKSEDEIFAYMLPAYLRQPKGSAINSKGILAVAASCAAERAAAPVARYIKEYYGTRAAQGKALIAMLAWIDHPSATQVMLAIGNRFRTKSIQEEATRQAEALAERKGWTLAELADRTIPTAGFDENGELELSYGSRAFVAKLLPDFKIELYNPEGKKVASLSEPRQDDDADRAQESKKALSAAKKEIKSIVALQSDRLYEALCTGREWPYADWHDYLNLHPVVRHLAQRLIWLQYADGGVVSVFRPLDDGTLTDADDAAMTLPPDARVRLAHDSLLPRESVERWKQHLVDYEIKPLFQQLGKGTYELPPEKLGAKELADFKGHLLEAYALRGRAGKLGYQRGAAEDGGWFHVYEKRFPTLGLTAVVHFTGSPLPEENRTVALLSLSFSSSDKQNSWERDEIPLKKIPKVLLSECYNDMRLMSADGTGFDPDWEKKSAY